MLFSIQLEGISGNSCKGGVFYVTFGTFLLLQILTNSGVTQDSRPLAEAMRQAFQQDWQAALGGRVVAKWSAKQLELTTFCHPLLSFPSWCQLWDQGLRVIDSSLVCDTLRMGLWWSLHRNPGHPKANNSGSIDLVWFGVPPSFNQKKTAKIIQWWFLPRTWAVHLLEVVETAGRLSFTSRLGYELGNVGHKVMTNWDDFRPFHHVCVKYN